MIRTQLLLTLSLAMTASACDLATTEVEADVKVDFTVDSTDSRYVGDFVINPDENPDVRDNRARIKSGEVTDIKLEILSLDGANLATAGDAKLYFRRFETGTWALGSEGTALVEVGTTPITAGTTIPVTPDAVKKTELAEILFADGGETKVDARFTGMADQAPVKFTGRATFHLKFKAGL